MKINEALDIINDTKTVRAKLEGSRLIFATKSNLGDNYWGLWFLAMNKDAHYWHSVEFEYAYLSGASSQDLARTMDVVQRLIDTPLDERHPKYYLKFLYSAPIVGDRYVKRVVYNGNRFTFELSDTPVGLSENDLAEIKQTYPSIAPAIDAMKEEVKDDD